jgi:hypothetical protein
MAAGDMKLRSTTDHIGRYIRITEKEAFEAFGSNYKDYWNRQAGGYVTG